MTVATTTNRSGPYTGNGVTVSFARTFRVDSASDLKVFQTVSGVTSEVTSGITKNDIGADTGTVVFDVAPASGVVITLIRSTEQTQGTDYASQGRVTPEQIESDLDLAIMQIQDLNERLGRTMLLDVSSQTAGLSLPEPQAGLLVRFNDAGDGFDVGPSYTEIDTARNDATGAATAAEGSASLASTKAGEASDSAGNAAASEAKAADWAEKTDGVVETGAYSAKYWATHPNIVTVSTDLGGANTIGTVAGAMTNIGAVAAVDGAVSTVAGIAANVTSVAGNATNINSVATNISNVNTVASANDDIVTVSVDLGLVNSTIETVAANLLGSNTVGTVAGAISNVNNVGGSIGNVNTVAGIAADVTTLASDINAVGGGDIAAVAGGLTAVQSVSANLGDINAVQAALTNIATVAANVGDIGVLEDNIFLLQAVGNDLVNPGGSQISVVYGNLANINTVAPIAANVTTVSGVAGDVTTVAGIASDVSLAATNMTNIQAAAGAVEDYQIAFLQMATAITNTNTRVVEHHAFA